MNSKEIFSISEDIHVLTFKASSFPQGIAEAHTKIQSQFSNIHEKTIFGISRPENGNINYWSAIKLTHYGNTDDFGVGQFTISKGEYISIMVNNYIEDPLSISSAFQSLTRHPGIDPEAYCIEWYLGEKDVKCMIKLI